MSEREKEGEREREIIESKKKKISPGRVRETEQC